MVDDLGTRAVRFDLDDDVDLVWNRRLPELACAANALSLLMPHVEPYVVRSTRAVLPLLDPPLRDRADGYLRQEAAHHHQHRRFNDLVAARYRGVAALDRAMAGCYGQLARRGGAHFGVAFAAGFETVAFAAARWVDHRLPELFDDADPTVSGLFLWHLAEEVEHKDVAFDVLRALRVRRSVHALAMVLSLVLVAAFTVAGAVVLLAAERRLWHPVAWVRLVRWSVSFAFDVLPLMAVSLLPGHHPRQLVDPPWLSLHLRALPPPEPRGPGAARMSGASFGERPTPGSSASG